MPPSSSFVGVELKRHLRKYQVCVVVENWEKMVINRFHPLLVNVAANPVCGEKLGTISDEAREWLLDQIGKLDEDWWYAVLWDSKRIKYHFMFKEKKHAALFKLRWC